ncbi:MAG TPA: serine/threonine-protein kinase [Kofleriaceae bacterium]|nr:serine/threonine-protein kinase [Kofleriaceae bacterium]
MSEHGGELAPGMDVGGYLIESKIGEGGMGLVYGAMHPQIRKRVAIKVLGQTYCRDPGVVERFEQEARLVNEIHHSNIIDVFGFGQLADGRKYLIMEWLDGESLTSRIDRGAIPAAEALEILDAICDAMLAVHEKGIVHRDLKSDNIFLVSRRGQQHVKLLDFGLAKLAGSNNPKAITKTRTGIVVGTPAYLSPEQARGKQADHRTDVYQLGVLAHKMLTGRLPFVGDTPVDYIVQHLQKPPPSPGLLVPSIPDALSGIVVRMMAKTPEERPTLADIRGVLAEVRAGRSPALGPLPPSAAGATGTGSQAALAIAGSQAALPIPAPAESAPAAKPASQKALLVVALVLLAIIIGGVVILAAR